MTIGKLRITIVQEWDVDNLEDYEAKTLEEAAKNQEKWFNEDPSSVVDLLDDFTFNIEVVKK